MAYHNNIQEEGEKYFQYFHKCEKLPNGQIMTTLFDVMSRHKILLITPSRYNLEKLAEHGVCQTNEDSPYDWGFCSRGCQVLQWSENKKRWGYGEPYDIAQMWYHETPPACSESMYYNLLLDIGKSVIFLRN